VYRYRLVQFIQDRNIKVCQGAWKRSWGRHRLRWMEDAENNLQGLKVNRWRKKACNRKE
jgi:hypothetical protein